MGKTTMQPDDSWDEELKEKVRGAYHGEYDIEKAREAATNALPKNHAWHQRGPHVVCTSCHAEHSYFIGITKNLTKNEEGEYVLVDRF
jgi:hypothetical protein